MKVNPIDMRPERRNTDFVFEVFLRTESTIDLKVSALPIVNNARSNEVGNSDQMVRKYLIQVKGVTSVESEPLEVPKIV